MAASSHDEEDAAVIGSHDMAYSGREELTSPFLSWLQSQGKTRWTIREIIIYSRKYGHILESGDASALGMLSPRNKQHAMTALAALSKYTGRYDLFLKIKERYNLKWTSGKESLQTFERFFNDELNYNTILQRIRQMISNTSTQMAQIIKVDCLTGLRPSEAVQSVKLLNADREVRAFEKYYNPERQALEHFKFPEVFLRRTKKAYLSFLSPEMLDIARNIHFIPSYNAIRLACRRKGINMDMRYCRKIFSSHLRQSGIESEIIDLLQGRVPNSVFARHYFTPSLDYRDKVINALNKLKEQIEKEE
ncbi:MAG TPA: integrase [Nitrososphaera sp.]